MKEFFKEPKIVAVMSLLSYLVAVVLSYLEDKVDMKYLVIGTVIIVFIILSIGWIYSTLSNEKEKEEIKEQVNILKDFFQANGLDNIISDKKLTEIEERADDIWVVTLDLANDINLDDSKNKEIFNIVQQNLKKGKKYVYFIPKELEKKGRLHRYKTLHSEYIKKDQVKFCIIDNCEFNFVSEIVVYDIDKKFSKTVQFFPNDSLNYYLIVDEKHSIHIKGILKNLLKKHNLIDVLDIS